eukprot:NODE_3_length_80033_cov_0.932970.p15 type:complete len:444 gc:universal NODE_3_length_80033_cov_0.932970:64297-62966(-)
MSVTLEQLLELEPVRSNKNHTEYLGSNKNIAYMYSDTIGTHYYAENHPMKPSRLALTHDLVMNYHLYQEMTVYKAPIASYAELTNFHSPEYISFLQKKTEDPDHHYLPLTNDCPLFESVYEYCQEYSGASILSAKLINNKECDIAVNWSGGLHHSHRSSASGFCYVNDIVLAIQELLKSHPRVLYIDIDVHHGDGVQEAFYTSDRVMTVSFHRYGVQPDGFDFFPGTGSLQEIGFNEGKNFSINVPLKQGITDSQYLRLFKSVMRACINQFQPGAVVLQAGADSLGLDRLGPFNLSIQGHAACVEFIKSFNIPMILLGGGGYTIRNVARCWAYETATVCNARLPQSIPDDCAYRGFFGPDHVITPKLNGFYKNENTESELELIKTYVMQQLKFIEHAPSIKQDQLPPVYVTKKIIEGIDDSSKLKELLHRDFRAIRQEFIDLI